MEPSGTSTTAPPTPKEVVEKPTYISITLNASKEVLEADLGHVANSKIQVNRAITIAPSYKEVVVSQRVQVPTKCFKNRQITIVVNGKEVAAQQLP